MTSPRKQIDDLINQAAQVHYDEVARRARVFMRAHPRWKSFVMGGGYADFVGKYGDTWRDDNHSGEAPKYMHAFFAFIDEYDGLLNTTGMPMRIQGPDGKLERDW